MPPTKRHDSNVYAHLQSLLVVMIGKCALPHRRTILKRNRYWNNIARNTLHVGVIMESAGQPQHFLLPVFVENNGFRLRTSVTGNLH